MRCGHLFPGGNNQARLLASFRGLGIDAAVLDGSIFETNPSLYVPAGRLPSTRVQCLPPSRVT